MSNLNLVQATVNSPTGTSDSVIVLAAAAAPYQLPPTDGGTLVLADNISRPTVFEIISYTSRSGNNLTGCVRGLEGTPQRTWPVGTYVYQAITANMFAQKVDKVAGKDLSTNDYTTLEKTKLATAITRNTAFKSANYTAVANTYDFISADITVTLPQIGATTPLPDGTQWLMDKALTASPIVQTSNGELIKTKAGNDTSVKCSINARYIFTVRSGAWEV